MRSSNQGPERQIRLAVWEIIAAGGSLTIDLSAIFSMLEKYADFSFESQNDLFDISEIFEKMLTLSSAPYSMQAENDYVEKGAALAFCNVFEL